MSIDFTITLGNLCEIVSIIGGGFMLLATLKTDVNALKLGSSALKNDIDDMQRELRKLSDVLISLADIRGELKLHHQRLVAVEQDLRDMRN